MNATPVKTSPISFNLSLFGRYSRVKVFENENRIEITDRTRRHELATMMQRYDSTAVKLFDGRYEALVIVCNSKKAAKIVLSLEGEKATIPHSENEVSDILQQIQFSPVMLH